MRKAAIVATLLLVLTAACSNDPGAIPEVPDVAPATTSTTDVDYSNVGLRAVPGRTPTSPVLVQPGKATLTGVVISEQGPVPGAKVNVERIVNGQVGQVVLLTAMDGRWELPGVLGGRYRVRAWRAPDLAQTTATVFFLEQAETKTLDLRVRTIGGTSVTSAFAPKIPRTDRDTNLVVKIAQKTVSDDGIVRAEPLPGVQVELVGSGAWQVRSSNPAFTDASGQADWLLRCRDSGRQPLAVSFGSETVPLSVESCVDRFEEPATTTTDPGEIITPTTTE